MWVQEDSAPPPSKAYSSCTSPCRGACGNLHPCWPAQAPVLRSSSRSKRWWEKHTQRWTDTTGPESCLGALEACLGVRGLVVAHCGSKDTEREGTREFFILLLLFLFYFFILFSVFIYWLILLLWFSFLCCCFIFIVTFSKVCFLFFSFYLSFYSVLLFFSLLLVAFCLFPTQHGLQGPGSQARDWVWVLALGVLSPIQWTNREFQVPRNINRCEISWKSSSQHQDQ